VDAAGALGSKYKNKNLGELDVACCTLSFNGNKIITSGGGGAVITNSDSFARKIRHLSTTARPTQDYIHDKIGYNYRMTNLEAAVGCAQIENLSNFLQRKQEIADAYKKITHQVSSVHLFPFRKNDNPNHWLCGLLLPSKAMTEKLMVHMLAKGVEVRSFWVPIHLQPLYKDCLKTHQDITEDIYQRILLLPCSTQLTGQEVDYVREAVVQGLSSLKCL
jgi:dTDP-4-amino-4,6-dideoxygalactose transaminase